MATKQQREIAALLKKLEPTVRKSFIAAMNQAATAVDLSALIAALEVGNTAQAAALLHIDSATLFPLTEALRTTILAGGASVAGSLPVKLRATFGFGGNPRAVATVERITGKIASVLSEEAAQTVREAIVAAVQTGIPPRQTALNLVGKINPVTRLREGGVLTLDAPRAEQARKVRAMLTDPDRIRDYFIGDRPRYTTTDRRFDRMVRKAIAEGRALTPAEVEKISSLHKSRLLKNRGKTVARTETLNALRTGQHEGFGELQDSGAVDAMTVTWLATKDARTRDNHRHLDGTTVPFGDLFQGVTGQLAFPGDTGNGAGPEDLVNCRCDAIYRSGK